MTRSMIDTPLQNTAAMTMSSDYNAMIANAVKDKLIHLASLCREREEMTHLGIIRCEMIKTLLNDMISIEVLDQIYNSIL